MMQAILRGAGPHVAGLLHKCSHAIALTTRSLASTPSIPPRLFMEAYPLWNEMNDFRIVISEFMADDAVAALSRQFKVEYDPDLVGRPTELERIIRDADALIVRNRTQVRGALLSSLRNGAVVGRLGVGLDNIDVGGARARGIEVISATGANAQAVAEYVLAASFMLMRGLHLATPLVAAGVWPRDGLSKGRELAGSTLGLIGFGSIGQATAKLARAVGMEVMAYDDAVSPDSPLWRASGVTYAALDHVLSGSDIVSLHIPLTTATRGLINAEKLSLFKRGALLINTARGAVVDEHAVAAALRSGDLAGAALDVFSEEPLKPNSAFADLRNVLLTPHIAGLTQESNARVSNYIADAVSDALKRKAT